MVCSAFTQTTVGNTILFANSNPIDSVGKISFYRDNASGSFSKKEYRWSFDKNHWSSWLSLNQENITSLPTGSNKYLYLEVKYISAGTGKVTMFSIDYSANKKPVSIPPIPDVNIDHNHVLPDGCGEPGGSIKTIEVVQVTDANTLCGKTCDYYLWRPNQKGTQPISSITDLQNYLSSLQHQIYVLDPSTSLDSAYNIGGGQEVFKQKDPSARALVFRTLLPGNLINLNLSPDSSAITIEVSSAVNTKFTQIDNSLNSLANWNIIQDGSLLYLTNWDFSQDASIQILRTENRWSDPDPVSADIGGILNNQPTVGDTAIQVLEKILYEYFPPNVTLDTTPVVSGYYEKFHPVPDISLYGSFNNFDFVKARITDVSLYSSLLGGVGTLSYPDVCTGTYSFSHQTISPNWDDITYTVKVYHTVDSVVMPPAEVSAVINFTNPFIWGRVDASITYKNISESDIIHDYALGNKIIVPRQNNTIYFQTIDPSLVGKPRRFFYAYDASYGPLNNIIDFYSNFNVTTSIDVSIINMTTLGGPDPIPYYVYIHHNWLDISTLKLIFNF